MFVKEKMFYKVLLIFDWMDYIDDEVLICVQDFCEFFGKWYLICDFFDCFVFCEIIEYCIMIVGSVLFGVNY